MCTPLNTDRTTILEVTRDEPCPNNIRSERRNHNRFCNYHQMSRHSNEDYRNLKKLIEKNVQSRELVQYVAGRGGSGMRAKNTNL